MTTAHFWQKEPEQLMDTWGVGKQQKETFLTTAVSDGSFCWTFTNTQIDMQSLEHSEL